MDNIVINRIKDSARQMINNLEELCDLGNFIREYKNSDIDYRINQDIFHKFIQSLPHNIAYATGASRLVLWDKNDKSYVCKVNINADTIDYNRAECEVYQEAVARGLSHHFAWCDKLMSYQLDDSTSTDISIMEFVDINYEQNSDDAFNRAYNGYCEEFGLEDSIEAMNKFTDDFDGWDWDDEESMFDIARAEWGKYDVEDIYTLLCDFGIADCHAGNWGRRISNDDFILTDYAGFGHQAGLAYFEKESV